MPDANMLDNNMPDDNTPDNNTSDLSDRIYASRQPPTLFQFDQKVAAVFPDMIKRSVPGYQETIRTIQQIAGSYITKNSNCYDLGCSLGAASMAMSYGNRQPKVKIFAVDNSTSMLEGCARNIEAFKHSTPIELVLKNIQDVTIKNASMVILNYTLQFISQDLRTTILRKIFHGMQTGGILLLSEKIIFADETINQLMIELHHQFKRENGYSELEISRKRNALETVLVPELMSTHVERLNQAGFKRVNCIQQQLNFASFVAIKCRDKMRQ